MEPTYSLKVLGMGTILVRFRLRIDAGWPDQTYCFRHIVGPETTGENDRYMDKFHDASTNTPVVRHANGTELLVAWSYTVEQ